MYIIVKSHNWRLKLMIINKKILLYSLLAGSAGIASHAWSMDNYRGSALQGWTNTANMASSSSSSTTGHHSYGHLGQRTTPRNLSAQLVKAMGVGAPSTQPVYHVPAASHTPASAHTSGGGTKDEEEEEVVPRELKRRRGE